MSEPATVRLEIGGNIIGHLNLHRTPKMLRFTVVGRDYKTLDALDQLDDEPRDNETLVAAVLVSRDMVHIDGRDKDGKRFGRWLESVTYRMIESLAARVAALEAAKVEPIEKFDQLEPSEKVGELANEAEFEGRLYRWDGKPEREPAKGEVFESRHHDGPESIYLVKKTLNDKFGPRRIFVPVEPSGESGELATEAWFEDKLYRYSETRTPREGKDVFAMCGLKSGEWCEVTPIHLVLAADGWDESGETRRIFVPVDEPTDPPLPEGVRREMKPVLYVPTRGGGVAEIDRWSDGAIYPLGGLLDNMYEAWRIDGAYNRQHPGSHRNLTVSLPADEWKRLLGVANKPENTQR